MSPAPTIGEVAEALYADLEPVTEADESLGWPLMVFCETLGMTIEEINTWVRDTEDDDPGWSLLLDIERCPTKALPWLAQFVGTRIPSGLTEQEQRDYIAGTANWKRGTAASMISAAQHTLTGDKTIVFRERFNGNAYQISVVTYTAETPSPAATEAALVSQKPAGLILLYSALSGQDYASLLSGNPLYTNVLANYSNYQDARDDT